MFVQPARILGEMDKPPDISDTIVQAAQILGEMRWGLVCFCLPGWVLAQALDVVARCSGRLGRIGDHP